MTQVARFKKGSDERRDYFRVLDAVGMDVYKLEPGESLASLAERAELALSDQSLGDKSVFAGLSHLRKSNPEAAAYIESLEQRIDSFSQSADIQKIATRPTHKVSLSGSGIAFAHDKLLQPGDRVGLGITFFPSGKFLNVIATVVSVGNTNGSVSGGKYAARAVFSNIDAKSRTIILEHINYVLSKM